MSEAEKIARALNGRKSGGGWVCSCPSVAHGGHDKNPSLSLTDGNDGKLLVRCHKGCTFGDVMAALRSRGLVEDKRAHVRNTADIIAGMAARAARPAPRTYTTEETYMQAEAQVEPLRRGRAWDPLEYERSHIYHDAAGNPCRLVAVKRLPDGDKEIVQFGRLADGSWDTKAPKGPMVPYRLPGMLAAEGSSPVFIVEGEKDVETLEALGHLATTNPNGALNWHKDLNKFFAGLEVLIVPDSDKTGEERIGILCSQLAGIASSIKIIRLPGLEFRDKHGEDITDWFEKHGHTNEEFLELAKAALEYEAAAAGDKLVVSSAEFLAGFVPPDYAFEGLLQYRFCYSLTAPTGHGKTAVALLLAAAKALGRAIGNHEVDPGRVLYFVGENPDDVRMRWTALAEKMAFDPDTIDVHFRPGTCKLSEVAPLIRKEVEQIGGVSFVIVDTSAAYNESDDENANVQAGTHARLMRGLVTLPGEPCVLVLCHPVKNATQDTLLPRGGGAFLAEVDGNLTCWKTDSLVSVHWQGKFRGPDFAPIAFQLETVTSMRLKDSKGRPIPSVVAKVLSDKERSEAEATSRGDEDALLLSLIDGERRSMMALASLLGWWTHAGEPNKSKVQRLVDRLKKGKLIEVDRSGVALTPKGKDEVKRLKLNVDLAGSRYG